MNSMANRIGSPAIGQDVSQSQVMP
jgi:hypothetical protein